MRRRQFWHEKLGYVSKPAISRTVTGGHGDCSTHCEALHELERYDSKRKTSPLRSRSKLSEALGAESAGVITRGCPRNCRLLKRYL